MLDLNRAQEAIRFFNQQTAYAASDKVIAKAFEAEVNPVSHLMRVSLLDALFATNLSKSKPRESKPRKSIADISEAIRTSLVIVEDELQNLTSQDLMVLDLQQEQVMGGIKRAVTIIVQCCNNESVSFATKYLHFAEPNLFAPWDSIVPKIARDILPQLNFAGNALNQYLPLLKAHQIIWKGFSSEDGVTLTKHDFETQPQNWRKHNTPVRIVDKILWAIGKSQSA